MAIVQDRKIEFSQPVRQIATMVVVLALVAVGVFLLLAHIVAVFESNVFLNGFILGVFAIGVLACFWQVFSLIRAVSWLEGFAIDRPGHEFVNPPRLLTSLASLLRDRRARETLTATSSRSLLDTVATRLDEQRDITRYIINLLVLVGLLGTFWGLSNVVPGIVATMRSLSTTGDASGDSMQVFANLMAGLNSQLDGMGTAFASSLLGLAGSLVVGLLDLFAGHGQNRFYRELEEWLSSISRISLGGGDGDGSIAGLAAEALDRNAGQIEALVAALRDAEDRQRLSDARLETLAQGLTGLVRALEEERESRAAVVPPAPPQPVLDTSVLTSRLDRIAQAQERAAHLLEKAQEKEETDEGRQRLRSIDLQISRLLEEVSAGRQEATAELRMDLARLTRAVNGERG